MAPRIWKRVRRQLEDERILIVQKGTEDEDKVVTGGKPKSHRKTRGVILVDIRTKELAEIQEYLYKTSTEYRETTSDEGYGLDGVPTWSGCRVGVPRPFA